MTKKFIILCGRYRLFFFLIVLPWFGHVFSNKGRFGHKGKLPGFFYFLIWVWHVQLIWSYTILLNENWPLTKASFFQRNGVKIVYMKALNSYPNSLNVSLCPSKSGVFRNLNLPGAILIARSHGLVGLKTCFQSTSSRIFPTIAHMSWNPWGVMGGTSGAMNMSW